MAIDFLSSVDLSGSLDVSGTLKISTASFPTLQIGSANTYKIQKDTVSGNTLDIYSGSVMGPTLEMNSSRNSIFYGSVDIANGGDLSVGDDLTMGSSGALLTLGNSSTVTLQHNGGFGGTLASNSTSGAFTIDSAHDIVLDAAGNQVYFKAGGSTRYTWNLDSTPELDVVGDFAIDGSGDITLDAANDVHLKSGAGEHIMLDESTTGGANTKFNIKTYYPDNIKSVYGTGSSSDGDWHIYANGGTNSDLVIESLSSNTGVGNIILRNKYQGDIEFADSSSTIFRMDNSSNALIVNSGNLTLEGTGRIQGVDTVSSSTDAANKAYVDAHTPTSTQTILFSNFSDDVSTTSSLRIPFNTLSDTTSNQYYNHFDCPANGTIKRIRLNNTSGTHTSGTWYITFDIWRSATGSPTQSSSQIQVASGGVVEYDPDLTFTKGDEIQIGFRKSSTSRYLRGVSASIIIEFEQA
jgi:hypothetical protein